MRRQILSRNDWTGGAPLGITLYCDGVAAPLTPREVADIGLARAHEADDDERLVALQFSSETTIDHFWFLLTLDHDPASIRLDRFRGGLGPILVDHSTRDQVGVIDEVSIGRDRTGRAVARFGRSARADEILRDIRDGIRRGVSVGFIVHQAVLEEIGDDVPKESFRAIDWEPLEVSIVPVPADTNAQILQSFQQANRETPAMVEATQDTPAAAPIAPAVPDAPAAVQAAPAPNPPAVDPAAIQSAVDAELNRTREIMALGGRIPGQMEAAVAAVTNQTPLVEFQRAVLEGYRPDSPQASHQSTPEAGIVAPNYAAMRTPKHFLGPTAREDAYQSGMWFRSVLYGDPNAQAWCRANGVTLARAASESVNTAGGFIVPTILETAIIDLRERFGVFRRIARNWPMASDNHIIPVSVSGLTANPVGENEEISESQKVWADVELTARKWGILTKYSTELAEDAVIQLADDLVSEIARAYAEAEDNAGFNGDGTSTFHSIQGINIKLIDGTHDASIVDGAAGIDTFVEIDNTDLTNMMGQLPEIPGIQPAWICSRLAWATVFSRLAAASGGNTIETIAGQPQMAYLGSPIIIAQKMPRVATSLAASIMLLYGDMNMASLFGDRRGLTITVSMEVFFKDDAIGIRGTERFDINNHGLGDNTNPGPIIGFRGTA